MRIFRCEKIDAAGENLPLHLDSRSHPIDWHGWRRRRSDGA